MAAPLSAGPSPDKAPMANDACEGKEIAIPTPGLLRSPGKIHFALFTSNSNHLASVSSVLRTPKTTRSAQSSRYFRDHQVQAVVIS